MFETPPPMKGPSETRCFMAAPLARVRLTAAQQKELAKKGALLEGCVAHASDPRPLRRKAPSYPRPMGFDACAHPVVEIDAVGRIRMPKEMDLSGR